MAFVRKSGKSTYPNLYEALDKFGQAYIDEIALQIIRQDKVATGRLLRSLEYKIVERVEGYFEIALYAEKYMRWVNGGRKPGRMPPLAPLEKWIRVKNIRFKKKSGQGFLSVKQTAFVIAKSLTKKTIRPTNILKTSIGQVLNKKEQLIKAGFQGDLTQLIKDTFQDIQNIK